MLLQHSHKHGSPHCTSKHMLHYENVLNIKTFLIVSLTRLRCCSNNYMNVCRVHTQHAKRYCNVAKCFACLLWTQLNTMLRPLSQDTSIVVQPLTMVMLIKRNKSKLQLSYKMTPPNWLNHWKCVLFYAMTIVFGCAIMEWPCKSGPINNLISFN